MFAAASASDCDAGCADSSAEGLCANATIPTGDGRAVSGPRGGQVELREVSHVLAVSPREVLQNSLWVHPPCCVAPMQLTFPPDFERLVVVIDDYRVFSASKDSAVRLRSIR